MATPRSITTAPLLVASVAAFVLLAASLAPARADYPVAPDVVVFCDPTLQPLMTALGDRWQRETGIPVRVFTAPTWANLAMLEHHTRDDVIIGEGDKMLAQAIAEQLVAGDSVQRLWRNKLVAATTRDDLKPAGAALPHRPIDLADVAGKSEIAIVDPNVSLAGKQTEEALRALGLWSAVRVKSIGVVGTADAAYLLAEGRVELAVLYASDVSAHPELTVTDTLPRGAGEPIDYWAARTQGALSPNATRFLDFLHQLPVREQGKEAGLEVLP
jgi:molybdate transport system substrate-binding protein